MHPDGSKRKISYGKTVNPKVMKVVKRLKDSVPVPGEQVPTFE